jgi:hypothetical protein
MKIKLLTSLCSVALALAAYGQDPTVSPAISPATPVPAATPALVASPSVAPIASPSPTAGDLETRIKQRTRGVHINVDRPHRDHEHSADDADIHIDSKDLEDIGPLAAIPIVGIIFGTLSLFGAPVFIVLVIMFFSYLKQRSLHRTVRAMVERGQEVPAALFAPPPVVKARSDMRRGVILIMVGIALMLFFAAVNDWEGGSWTLGLIPFLIGAGYLTVWRLEGNKPGMLIPPPTTTTPNTGTDIPPRVP